MITLFDIPSTAPGSAWSLNPWRTRLALTYKGIPFRTEWVEYPDIKPVLLSHNIQPTGTLTDGSGYYSVPAILDVDDATGELKTALADSFPIAKYLDEAYPDTPRLIPEGTSEDQEAFARGYIRSILPILIIMIKVGLPKLNERSQDHYSTARGEDFFPLFNVKRVEEWPWSEEDQAKHWADAKKALDALDGKLAATDAKGPWYLGDRISFADFIIGASLIWMEVLLGEESEEWKNVTAWNGGRWKKFIEGISEWRVKGLEN